MKPVPIASQIPLWVIRVSPTPNRAEQRGEVLQQDHRQLRRLRRPDEPQPGLSSLHRNRLADRGAERERFGDDRRHQHDQRNPPPGPLEHLVGVPGRDLLGLMDGLVQREQAAEAEQDDRDQEGAQVALAAVAEGVLLGRVATGAAAADQQQDLVPGVGDRVDGLRQHRGRAGQGPGPELRRGDERVGQQCGDDRPGSSVGAHPGDSATAVGRVDGGATTSDPHGLDDPSPGSGIVHSDG
jgi:hypothetical protein